MVGYFRYGNKGRLLYVPWPCVMSGGNCEWLVPIPEAWQAACNDDDSLYDMEVSNA